MNEELDYRIGDFVSVLQGMPSTHNKTFKVIDISGCFARILVPDYIPELWHTSRLRLVKKSSQVIAVEPDPVYEATDLSLYQSNKNFGRF